MKKNILLVILLICIAGLGTMYYNKVDNYKYLQSSIDQRFQQQMGLLISALNNLNNETIEANEEYKQVLYSLTYLRNMMALTTYNKKNKKLEEAINYLYDYEDKDLLIQSELVNPDNLELKQILGHFHMDLNSEKNATLLINFLKKDKKNIH
ncbi:hypothetical protein [Vallitalea guaymasensis]|uniref:Uncharacterized protein n=1 Tax=Vallitalea guaymasensis TaxID=1185412 RepID=A0A8J8MC42_9FIRM|nr:hypothetical protein [Vallitalea guaymasensis]QUH30284.1 hypothetical protein HYG85_15775 [Vallitalea guaymasensis]